MVKKKILVVDDDRNICELVKLYLDDEFDVDTAFDGDEGLSRLNLKCPDMLILDIMLPKVNGLEVCRETRKRFDLPIIMLTAKGEETDKILGLELGADDYITKPFSTRELTARTKAILRRSEKAEPAAESAATGTLKVKDMVIDKEKYTVIVDTRQIKLSATEFKLLLYLAERPDKIYNRDQLLDAVWGNDVYVEPRTVDVHIRRLRAKIEKDPNNPKYIKTMRGIGYLIESGNG